MLKSTSVCQKKTSDHSSDLEDWSHRANSARRWAISANWGIICQKKCIDLKKLRSSEEVFEGSSTLMALILSLGGLIPSEQMSQPRNVKNISNILQFSIESRSLLFTTIESEAFIFVKCSSLDSNVIRMTFKCMYAFFTLANIASM